MKNLPFNTAYTYISSIYGLDIDQHDFESSGMIAYERIGNTQSELKHYVGNVINGELHLPCDTFTIEGVFADFPDVVTTSNKERYPYIASSFVERYIEYWKINKSLLYDYGRLLKYRLEGEALKFDKDYTNVLVLYTTPILDNEGYPYINSKEAEAIAAFCAYTHLYRKAIATKDGDSMNLALNIKQEWARLCERARVPETMSQNDMDKILDAHTSWDRKMYHKSFKPDR